MAAAGNLLDQVKADSGDEPGWIDFHQHARLSMEAAEILRTPPGDLPTLKVSEVRLPRSAHPAAGAGPGHPRGPARGLKSRKLHK